MLTSCELVPGRCALDAAAGSGNATPRLQAVLEPPLASGAALGVPVFEQVYAETFRPVWRLLRRLGVAGTALDDVAQEVFVVVYRKLPEFTWASSVKTWVLAITTRVVRNYRRTWRRKGAGFALATLVEDPELISDSSPDPSQQLSRVEAARLVQQLLDEMSDDKASLFVLVEVEGLSAAEVARALDVNVQTIYSRLAAARREFERGLRHLQMRERA